MSRLALRTANPYPQNWLCESITSELLDLDNTRTIGATADNNMGKTVTPMRHSKQVPGPV